MATVWLAPIEGAAPGDLVALPTIRREILWQRHGFAMAGLAHRVPVAANHTQAIRIASTWPTRWAMRQTRSLPRRHIAT